VRPAQYLALAITSLAVLAVGAAAWVGWKADRKIAVERAVKQAGFRNPYTTPARYRTPCPAGEDALVVTGDRSDNLLGEGYVCVPAFGPPVVLVTRVEPAERIYLY